MYLLNAIDQSNYTYTLKHHNEINSQKGKVGEVLYSAGLLTRCIFFLLRVDGHITGGSF